ncbi:hypothetical protein E2I00_006968, partial [Balaenoptera physalus]
MHQTIPVNPERPKMSACSDFVEHIWKPGPESGRPEDEGLSSSPYSKPTIAVKPTMMSSEASDGWTEAGVSADVAQVIWRRAPGKLPLPKQEDVPLVYLGSFRGVQKPAGPLAPADGGHPRCPPAYAMVGLHSLEPRGERSVAFHPVSFPDEKLGREDKPMIPYQELTSPQESFRQKLAAFAEMTSGCHKGPRPYPSALPLRESLPSEDDSDQRCSPSGDSEGGEYCSLLDCCPGGPGGQDASQAEDPGRRQGCGDCSPACWEQGVCAKPTEEERRALSVPRECRSQGPTENPPRLGPKKQCLGLTGEPQAPAHPGETAQPEPIYAESTKRKKAVPVPSRPQAKAEQAAAAQGQGQVRMANTWAQKTASGWGQDKEGPEVAPQVAATITAKGSLRLGRGSALGRAAITV